MIEQSAKRIRWFERGVAERYHPLIDRSAQFIAADHM
jgi:hypothetical protein